MQRVDKPELSRKLLNHMATLYNIREVREPNHLSSYVYCQTRGFFDQKGMIEPTDDEAMLFAIGYGLQDVLTPKDMATPVYSYDGIIYRPDMSLTSTFIEREVEQLIELKTTRRSAKYHATDLPETWLDYMMGGCKIRGTKEYDLVVLYICGNYSPPFPLLYAETIIFAEQEIEENWQKLLGRKRILDDALRTDIPPTPFEHCYEWECRFCRYKLVCETMAKLG